MKYISILIGIATLGLSAGCKKDNYNMPVPTASGIAVSPIATYQELLPGAMLNFSLGIWSPDSVTTFGVRFMFPGTSAYVSLPEYPDTTKAPEFAGAWGTFEYAMPPSVAAVDTTMKFKVLAGTKNNSYEKEYVVRMRSLGNQRLRLYSPTASGYFKFTALDLLKSTGVPTSFPSLTTDITVATISATYPVSGQTVNVIVGWNSGNGTKFKVITAAQYLAAPSTYAAVYVPATTSNEFTGVSSLGAKTGISALLINNYYMAKVNRNGVFSYVAMNVKVSPLTISTNIGSTTVFNLVKEYLEIEIRK